MGEESDFLDNLNAGKMTFYFLLAALALCLVAGAFSVLIHQSFYDPLMPASIKVSRWIIFLGSLGGIFFSMFKYLQYLSMFKRELDGGNHSS